MKKHYDEDGNIRECRIDLKIIKFANGNIYFYNGSAEKLFSIPIDIGLNDCTFSDETSSENI